MVASEGATCYGVVSNDDDGAEWLSVLDAHGVPVMPVWTVPEQFSDEHLRATGMFQEVEHPSEGRLRLARCPVTFSASAPADCRPAPRLGEHGAELLAELGYAPGEIRALGGRSQRTPT